MHAVRQAFHGQLLVSFGMLDSHVDVIKAADSDAWPLALFAARKAICEQFKLRFTEFEPVVSQCIDKVVHKELLWVVRVALCSQHRDEVVPLVCAHSQLDVLHEQKGFRLHHLEVDLAEDAEVLRHMPAMIVLATLDSCLPGHVLSPIRALVRLNLFSNRLLEVLVADPTIPVRIEVVEEIAELLF